MRFRATLPAVSGLLALSAGAVLAQAPEGFTKLADQWEAAFNRGDFGAVAALFTEDAARMPPEQPVQTGPAAIEAGLGQNAGMKADITVLGGLLGDEVGTSWGEFELSGTMEGEAVTMKGRWMNAVKKMPDGTWKIHRDIWNLAAPPPR